MAETTTVVVRRRLKASPEALFATLADSGRLARVRGIGRVRRIVVPVDHRFGRIEFVARDGHTEGVWTSTFAINAPLVGPVVARAVAAATRIAFGRALVALDRAARAETEGVR